MNSSMLVALLLGLAGWETFFRETNDTWDHVSRSINILGLCFLATAVYFDVSINP